MIPGLDDGGNEKRNPVDDFGFLVRRELSPMFPFFFAPFFSGFYHVMSCFLYPRGFSFVAFGRERGACDIGVHSATGRSIRTLS